jgi:polysaccharide pyruvyl transferase WcaK-like protein
MKWVCPRVIRGNRGDLLSRQGILQALLARGEQDVTVFALTDAHVPAALRPVLPYGPLYNLVPLPPGRQALRRADTVLWTGGLDLQDDSSLAKLVHTLAVFSSYRLLGLRIIAVMQGAGPLTTTTGRWLARQILNRMDVFIARDPKTLALLTALRPRCQLVLAHDGIFAGDPLAEPLSAGEAELVQHLVGAETRPVIGFNLRLWFHFASSLLPYQFVKRRYRARSEDRMRRLIDAAQAVIGELRHTHRARIILLSMYEPAVELWEDDLPYLERIKQSFAADSDVQIAGVPLSLRAFAELIRRLDLVVGMRLHSALAAIRLGVPAVHLAYTLKGHDIFAALGLADYVVAVEQFLQTPSALSGVITRVLAQPGLRNHVQHLADRTTRENERIFQAVLDRCAREMR